MAKEETTEDKILKAAEDVFLRDGIDGARMQEIADTAGINKAMLHYYFRSKELLFERVFNQKALFFFPEVTAIFEKKDTLSNKVADFVEKYILFMNEHPIIPFFIISTINKKGRESFIEKLPFREVVADNFFKSYQEDLEKGLLPEINPMQFLLSVIGMCVFPYLGRPILQHSFQLTHEQFLELMVMRISEVQNYTRKILSVS